MTQQWAEDHGETQVYCPKHKRHDLDTCEECEAEKLPTSVPFTLTLWLDLNLREWSEGLEYTDVENLNEFTAQIWETMRLVTWPAATKLRDWELVKE